MLHKFNTNLISIVRKYLEMTDVPFTKKFLNRQLFHNPHYPSLYCISNVFSKYNISNEAYVVEKDNFSLLKPPFITYYSGGKTGKDFIVVIDITDTEVSFYGDGNSVQNISRDLFFQNWEKIVLLAETSVESSEPDYIKNRKEERKEKIKKVGWITGGIVTILLSVLNFYTVADAGTLFFNSLILFTKMSGFTIAVLLLIYDYDKTNTFVKSICSTGKQTSCDAVLNSKAGKIFGIKWSDAGFFYFASSVLFLLYPGISLSGKIPFLAMAATLVSPYIIFSVYYQAKVTKQWCPLCLFTQLILFIELVWAFFSFWQQPSVLYFSIPLFVGLFASILIPILSWLAYKKVLYEAKDAASYEAAYKRILYHPEQFNQLLQQQETAVEGWQQLGINIGNPNAEIKIIKVCNPYCGPCAKAHPILEDLLRQNGNITVKIIFTASNEENDRSRKPVSHLMAIAGDGNDGQIEKALDDWYLQPNKDYEIFALKYPKNGELARQADKITAMKEWCNKASITHTPTFFINGKRLPETYRIEELKNIF